MAPCLAADPARLCRLMCVCAPAVARSHHFLGLEQAEPYGDILLSRGDNLQAEDDEE